MYMLHMYGIPVAFDRIYEFFQAITVRILRDRQIDAAESPSKLPTR